MLATSSNWKDADRVLSVGSVLFFTVYQAVNRCYEYVIKMFNYEFR